MSLKGGGQKGQSHGQIPRRKAGDRVWKHSCGWIATSWALSNGTLCSLEEEHVELSLGFPDSTLIFKTVVTFFRFQKCRK